MVDHMVDRAGVSVRPSFLIPLELLAPCCLARRARSSPLHQNNPRFLFSCHVLPFRSTLAKMVVPTSKLLRALSELDDLIVSIPALESFQVDRRLKGNRLPESTEELFGDDEPTDITIHKRDILAATVSYC